jgi:hypothetical protein
MFRIISSSILAGLVASALSAQEPNGRLLAMRVDTLAIHLIRGTDTSDTGIVVDELSSVTEGGEDLIRRVYTSSDRILGNRVDTLIDARANLAPRVHRSRSSRTLEFLTFSRGQVSGWLRLANGDSVAVNQTIDASVLNASSLDLALRSMPLTPKWQATIPVFLAATKAVTPITARVEGVDSIRGAGAWRVVADFAGMPVTFWIDQQSRALVQQSMRIRPDVSILFIRVSLPVSKDRSS